MKSGAFLLPEAKHALVADIGPVDDSLGLVSRARLLTLPPVEAVVAQASNSLDKNTYFSIFVAEQRDTIPYATANAI